MLLQYPLGGGGYLLAPRDEVNSITIEDRNDQKYFVKVGELFDSETRTINKDNYKILLKYITGNASATLSDVTALAETNNNQFSSSGYDGTDASVIRAKTLSAGTEGGTSYSSKSSRKDICVRLGGLDWQVMYLSKSTDGDTIVTLWLDNNIQDAWTSRSSTEGAYYGFYDGGLYSLWGCCIYNGIRSFNEIAYGASYVNAVTLNNGGMYYVNDSSTQTASKSDSSAFALFTMPEFGLTKYLITPSNVSWQIKQKSSDILEYIDDDETITKYNYLTNEEINGYYYSKYNQYGYWNSSSPGDWGESYLWLPSLSEVGLTSNNLYDYYPKGLWNSCDLQRDFSKTSEGQLYEGGNDYHGDDVYHGALLRSVRNWNSSEIEYILTVLLCNTTIRPYANAEYCNGYQHYYIGNGIIVTQKRKAIRPALHLNLSAIDGTLSSVSVGELYDDTGQTFNEDNYNILLKYLTGNADATLATTTALADTNNNQFSSSGYTGTDAGIIRSSIVVRGKSGDTWYSAKTIDQDIVVTLGGLKWQVMYLSKSTDGDTLLTLWLDNSTQDAWIGRSSTEGAYYGYIDGGLYSMWSANYNIDNPGDAYPSNMYGTSYINTVTLNNGGYYSTSGTAKTSFTKSTSSAFALFTMSQYGLTDYLVTPRKVSWQEEQSAKVILDSYSYRLPNEAYASNIANSEFYYDSNLNAYYNYSNKTYNDAWADNYLWLPSRSEVGSSSSDPGLWNTSTTQRQNYDGTTTSALGTSGSSGGSAYAYTYLRSGHNNSGRIVPTLAPAGQGLEGTNWYVNYCMAVRPALHLNLSAIYSSLNAVSLNEGEITVSPTSAIYDGLAKNPTITVKYNGTTLTKNTDYSLSYSRNGSAVTEIKEAGIYTITATGKKTYKDTISTTFEVLEVTEISATISPPNDRVTFKQGDGPKIYLQEGSYMLVLGTDYTVTHTINYTALTGIAVIVGIGSYGGTMTINYTIILLDPVAHIYLAVFPVSSQ